MAEGTKKELIDKVAKLLALANDSGATEGEKAAAAHHAAKLMYKYGIEESDIGSREKVGIALEREDIQISEVHGQRILWESFLAGSIAKTFDCRVINTRKTVTDGNGRTGRAWHVAFIGMRSDLDVSTYFFKFLRRTVGKKSDSMQYKDRRTFAVGMVEVLAERLEQAYKYRYQFAQEAGTTDIILAKDAAVANKVNEIFPNRKSGPKIELGSYKAYEAGKKAGREVNIARPLTNNGATKRQLD